MEYKNKILDDLAVKRALIRITHEVIERNKGVEGVCLLGVKTRGVPLAKILHDNILNFEGVSVDVGELDITLHRDDISPEDKKCVDVKSTVPFDLTNKTVIIVDDVLFTGRTVRAAIETVFSYARPKAIQLAVLIDRGHRELPIKPDFVGKNVPTSNGEKIIVQLDQTDGETAVYISNK